ncbi:MAG: relaxase domain-containing protein [Halobacteriovoraceae bacterium]|nr:relaxase domain-containing protein [Halobacteriovoraceae bacterium]
MKTISGAKAGVDYYKSASGEYYDKDSQISVWQGKIAKDFGLDGEIINFDTFENFSKGLSPIGEALVRSAGSENHRVGFDLTFSAPKSVSVLSLHDPKIREQMALSVEKTLNWVEKTYPQSRYKLDGNTWFKNTSSLIAAKFEHMSNRNGEPDLHIHSVIMNLTKDSEGQYRTFRNEKIYIDQKTIGQVFRNYLAKDLQKIGYSVEVTSRKEGFFEIKGVSREIIDDLSSRSKETEIAKEELIKKYPNASKAKIDEMAGLNSRLNKVNFSIDQIKEFSEKVLSKHKTNLEMLCENARNFKEKPEYKQSAKEVIKTAIKAVEINQSAWREEDVIKAASKLSLTEYDLDDLKEGLKDARKSKNMNLVGEKFTAKGNFKYYSSPEMIKAEKEIKEIIHSGKNRSEIFMSNINIENELHKIEKDGIYFEKGQKESFKFILKEKDQFIGVQGDAGTGKTFMVNYVRSVMEQKGVNVIGLAPTGKAADGLKTDANIKDSRTIDSFLLKNKEDLRNGNLPKKELWVVDEAGMISSKKMNNLLKIAQKRDAKVVLIGDIKQFESIEQGKIFSDLQKSGVFKFSEMKDVIRQKTEITRCVVSNFNNYFDHGKKPVFLQNAFNALKNENLIAQSSNWENHIEEIKNEYITTIKENKSAAILVATNKERIELNESIRSDLKDFGKIEKKDVSFSIHSSLGLSGVASQHADEYKVGQVVFTEQNVGGIRKGIQGKIVSVSPLNNSINIKYFEPNEKKFLNSSIDLGQKDTLKALKVFNVEDRNFSVGDKIILLKNDSKIGIQNGQTGQITNLKDNGDCQVNINNKIVSFNLALNGNTPYNYIDHAYALTDYKSQGDTFDKLIWSVSSDRTNFNAGYVATTRTKESIKIFTDDAEKLEKSVANLSNKVSTLEFENKKNNRVFDAFYAHFEPNKNAEQLDMSSSKNDELRPLRDHSGPEMDML